jgi:hypothetical protein
MIVIDMIEGSHAYYIVLCVDVLCVAPSRSGSLIITYHLYPLTVVLKIIKTFSIMVECLDPKFEHHTCSLYVFRTYWRHCQARHNLGMACMNQVTVRVCVVCIQPNPFVVDAEPFIRCTDIGMHWPIPQEPVD